MTGQCSICLSPFKEPVSIPCGHVYCTKCLADHVNTPGSQDTTSSCPTCRTVFNIVTPDLTYLPKKYHQYVIPGVRRVYLDTSREAAIQKKLTKAENTVRKLEAEQETLLKQCEQHMSASRAHADGEMKERQRANKLQRSLDTASAQVIATREDSEAYIERIEADHEELTIKYHKLKKYHRDLKERSKSYIDISQPEIEHEISVDSNDDNDVFHPSTRRRIRPLPRKRAGPMSSSASQPPIDVEPAKRPRLSAPGRVQAGRAARR